MPIFRVGEKNILFIHIPKTGGTSILRQLSDVGPVSFYAPKRKFSFPCVPQHVPGEVYEYLFDRRMFDYVFAVVRNPYDRILSEYRYRASQRRMIRLLFPNFEHWFRMIAYRYRRNPFLLSNHVRPQAEFLIPDTDVFRLEEGLDSVRTVLEEKTGVRLGDVPFENQSTTDMGRIDARSARLVYEFYCRDFELFGYDKDSYREDLGAARVDIRDH